VYALVRRYAQRVGARQRRLQAAGPLPGAAIEPAEAHP
jgi:hypothetical protein